MVSVPGQSDRRGALAVEAALVFPLLLLLTFALIEYGWMFIKTQQIINATRHGARIAVTPDATNAQVLGSIASYMDAAGMGSSNYVVTCSPASVSEPDSGQTVTVQVQVPYRNINLMDVPLVPVPTTISASASMAKEGP